MLIAVDNGRKSSVRLAPTNFVNANFLVSYRNDVSHPNLGNFEHRNKIEINNLRIHDSNYTHSNSRSRSNLGNLKYLQRFYRDLILSQTQQDSVVSSKSKVMQFLLNKAAQIQSFKFQLRKPFKILNPIEQLIKNFEPF